MATFTLRQLLQTQTPIVAGNLALSGFVNDGSTIEPQFILLDTIDGPSPGLAVRVDPRVATTADLTQAVGITFVAEASTPAIVGASVSMDGYSFAAPDAGGVAAVALTQGRRPVDNIGVSTVINNEPGGADAPQAAGDITGGPVPRFTFEYDMTVDPNNGVAAGIGQTTILFNVVGGGGGTGLPPGFDGLQYIASHGDLIQAFGPNAAAGEQHFLSSGRTEGRTPDGFNEIQYLANYPDLQAAFGGDTRAATVHYIQSGFAEQRNDDAPAFNGLQYIASHTDLIQAFGANEAAGTQHWQQFGQAEGRAADSFDEAQYLANNPDVQAAFGGDGQAATVHYIQFGFAEGRTDDIFSV